MCSFPSFFMKHYFFFNSGKVTRNRGFFAMLKTKTWCSFQTHKIVSRYAILKILTLKGTVALNSMASAAVLVRRATQCLPGQCRSRFHCPVEQRVLHTSRFPQVLWQCPVPDTRFCCRSYWPGLCATSPCHTSRRLNQSPKPILWFVSRQSKKKTWLRSSKNLTPCLC